jgi:hypothetical protein
MRVHSSSVINVRNNNWQCRSLSVAEKVTISLEILRGEHDLYQKASATILLCNAVVYKSVAKQIWDFLKEHEGKLNPVFACRLRTTAQKMLS